MLIHVPKPEIVIRAATESDATQICQVLIRSIREVCAADYGCDQAILDDWCANKTPEQAINWIRDSNVYFIVAELQPHGVVGVGAYKRDKAYIYMCYLSPEGLHRGIGSKLLREMEAEAKRLGQPEIILGSSITALSFYERHGYQRNGEPAYWGKVMGYPMKKRLI